MKHPSSSPEQKMEALSAAMRDPNMSEQERIVANKNLNQLKIMMESQKERAALAKLIQEAHPEIKQDYRHISQQSS